LYPVVHSGFETYAQFGVGIGIYFAQLVILIIVSFICGMIMIQAMVDYRHQKIEDIPYNLSRTFNSPYLPDHSNILSISASCTYVNVTATINCPNDQLQCIQVYSPNCELPYSAAAADLAMCVIFAIAILFSRFVERNIETRLDDAVQTATDYSVIVENPPANEDNPMTWYTYFSKYGDVQYITILRQNANIIELLEQKYFVKKSIQSLKQRLMTPISDTTSSHTPTVDQIQHYELKIQHLEKKLAHIESHIENAIDDSASHFHLPFHSGKSSNNNDNENNNIAAEAIPNPQTVPLISSSLSDKTSSKGHIYLPHIPLLHNERYPVCKVFVTFEKEFDQKRCLNALERPDIEAYLNITNRDNEDCLINGTILNVKEPLEPDNIIWKYLISPKLQHNYRMMSFVFIFYIGFLVIMFYLLDILRKFNVYIYAIVIGLVDSSLPTVFDYLAEWTCPLSESSKQNLLQILLFVARLFISRVIPYTQVQWNQVLTSPFLYQILVVQATACFVSTLIDLSDIVPIFWRQILAPLVSSSQEEYLVMWMQSADWSIASKYTDISKVLFVSLFYALLTPISIFMMMASFFFIFFADNYLLLRRWKVPSMLDSKIASRLRQQAVFSIAVHMYVTIRFIYSWPMDGVYWNGEEFEVVNKYPAYQFSYLHAERWQSEGQKSVIYQYRACLYFTLAAAIYLIVVEPCYLIFHELFFKVLPSEGECSDSPFSLLQGVDIYFPTAKHEGRPFLAVHAIDVLPRHIPAVHGPTENLSAASSGSSHLIDIDQDLSEYIPKEKRSKVLSIVQYFGKKDIDEDKEAQEQAEAILKQQREALLQKRLKQQEEGGFLRTSVLHNIPILRNSTQDHTTEHQNIDHLENGQPLSPIQSSNKSPEKRLSLGGFSLFSSKKAASIVPMNDEPSMNPSPLPISAEVGHVSLQLPQPQEQLQEPQKGQQQQAEVEQQKSVVEQQS
jgi:hypothetical protein